ncbi:fat storage-inducing transmembrane protein 1 [Latimeria chalumnae]|uniref:Fat storage-inducing transmembrane protein 1 homolog n=1 Tax=Latimeria chalumnae TaxID=7897 RepID=H3AMI3_LATCH|nr:PREDICTED: fat storage-inducing transmembrane protein 1 [Latimeria chalumnae]|eukprot:XP_006008361.1 PREDICTED: fat storage-inducing transmembrane protein 1 [Latimeria chalumnae]
MSIPFNRRKRKQWKRAGKKTDILDMPQEKNMLFYGLLVFLSDQNAKLLGTVCIRCYYHLWLAFIVICGPLLQFYVSPRTIFANKRNFFNVAFVKSAWGWTCILVGGFMLLVVQFSCWRILTTLRHLTRLVVGAALCFACTQIFYLVEDVTGSCFQPLPDGLLLTNFTSKLSCLAEGHLWRGYDISRPTFLLTYCSLLMLEELSVFRRYLALGRLASAPLRIIFLLNCFLLGLWNFLLLCTVVYFHDYSHKVVGAAAAKACWHLTYNWWYWARWSPGRPGQALFPKTVNTVKLE